MSDKPYNVGFLEEITNVHFGGGGPFLGLFIQNDTGASSTMHLAIDASVSIDGRSFPMISPTAPLQGGPSSRVLSKQDVETPYPKILPFSVPVFTDAFLGKHVEQMIVADLSSFKKPFNVVFHFAWPDFPLIDGNFNLSGSSLFLWSDKQWKQGVHCSIAFFSFDVPPSTDDDGDGLSINSPNPPGTLSQTFRIDPIAKTITYLGRSTP